MRQTIPNHNREEEYIEEELPKEPKVCQEEIQKDLKNRRRRKGRKGKSTFHRAKRASQQARWSNIGEHSVRE